MNKPDNTVTVNRADLDALLQLAAAAVAHAGDCALDDSDPVVGGGYDDTTVTEAEALLARFGQ